MRSTGGKRATSKRPPWTMFPPGARRAPPYPVEARTEAPPKRQRVMAAPEDPSSPRDVAPRLINATAPYERRSRCGRTTRDAAAGRHQQWRRQCLPLPPFQRKLNKGHLLTFDWQWQCPSCPCPAHRLTNKRCRGRSSRPPGGPLPGPGVPPASGGAPPEVAQGQESSTVPGRARTLRDCLFVAPPAQGTVRLTKPTGGRLKASPLPNSAGHP